MHGLKAIVRESVNRWLFESAADSHWASGRRSAHETLAAMLGVQRSTVSTVLRTLQTTGLIEQRRGGIVVTDRTALEQATCECYHKVRLRVEKVLPARMPHPDPDGLVVTTARPRR